MGRIAETFRRLKGEGRKALIPYVTAGDPSLSFTRTLIPRLFEAGAELIELGIPFSDPIADGPTIQRASQRALASGTTLRQVLGLVGELREEVEAPLILMTYYNPVLAYGEEALVEDALGAGVDGLIIPDLPPEEGALLREKTLAGGPDLIFMLAPTSTPERVKLVNEVGRGFIYYVAQMGVTGARERLSDELAGALERLSAGRGLPLAVGFGIKTPEQAASVASMADGVIVGSALIDAMEKESGEAEKLEAAVRFIGAMAHALREASGAPLT